MLTCRLLGMVTKFQNRVMNSKSTGENSRSPFNEDSIVAKCLASIADKDINNVKETRSSSPPNGCGTSNKINVSSPSPLTKNVMVGTMTTATTGIPASSSSSSASSSSSCVSPSFPNSNLDEQSKSVERKESTKSHINKTFNSRGDNIKSVKDDERKAQADPSKTFSDDSRLSRLMRRLLKESDRDRRLNAAKQLKDYLRSSDGVKAAGKVTEELLAALQDLFYDRIFKEIKSEVAICIGTIGSIMGSNADRYFQWLFAQINSAPDDDIRQLFLLALLETLKCDEKKQTLADFMQNVMANVQTLLENADSAEILIAVVDVIQQLSTVYPLVFNSQFRDTVDILVGWHIDLTQKESLTQYTSEALISFHQFWIRDLNFSITLLGQFLEDMEAYADDLLVQVNGQNMTEHEVPAAAECNTKISALLKVFTTVVKSLGDSFSPNKGPTISREYISDVLEKIIRSVEHAGRYIFSERVRIVANNCLTLLVNQLQNNLIHNMESLLPYITTQVTTENLVSDKFVLSLLGIIQKVVEYINFNLPVTFITTLLGPNSLLLTARASHNEEILVQLMTVYNGVMSLKNVPLLEEAYRIVVGDIETAYNRLLKECNEEAITIVVSNSFENQEYTIKQAETVLIFNLSALAEIYNTKNNLIVMWALAPSIFDLLIKYLNPLNTAIAERFPAVQYATIHSLYSHSTRHSNFISSSNLLTQNTALEGSVLAGVSPATSGHFSAILGLLVDILSLNMVTYDCKCLCLKWCSEIANTLQTSQHVYLTNEFGELLKALIWLGYDREHQICLSACQCLHNVLKSSPSISDDILIRCIELCLYRLSDHHKNVKDVFSSLLKAIPLNLTASFSTLVSLEDGLQTKNSFRVRGLKAAWLARRQHICRSQPGNFHSHNFRQIMAYILQNNLPSTFGSLNWLESMFYCAQRQEKEDEKKDDAMSLCFLVSGNYALLWFWSTWEAAQFCVLSRLRTPLGKPQETFTTIESVIKSYAAEIRSKGDLEDGLKTYDHKKGEKNADYNASVRVHLLLQFMEHLEKQLYNAYEGCAVAMAAAPKPVRTFFRTNKGTCQEWLNRIRTHIMLIALHCGMPSMVIRQASELLWDLKESNNTQGSEFEHIIMYMVQALVELKCPEAVQGIYNWCKDVIGRKLPWIKAMIEKACGRYETAAKECKLFLRTSFSKDTEEKKGDSRCASPESTIRGTGDDITRKVILTKFPEPDRLLVHFISNEVTDCYMKLSDWESALEWQDTMQEYRSDFSLGPINKAFSSAVDINYIKSLSYFDSGNYSGVRESMELIPGMSLSESVLNNQLPLGLIWSPKHSLEHAHKQFIRIVTLLQEHKSNTHKNEMSKCLDHCERLLENVLIVQSLQWPTFLPSEYIAELDIVAALKKQLDDKRGKMALIALSEKLVLDEADQDVSTYLQVMRLLNLQYHLLPGHDKRSDLNSQMTRLRLSTASLARKQHNHQLAERLLQQHMKSLLKNPENGKLPTQEGVLPALTSLHTNNCNGLSALDILKVEREYAKLLHSIGQHKEGLDVVSSSIAHFHEWGGDSSNSNTNGIGGGATLSALQKIKDKAQQGQCNELCARSLLTLVKWLQLDHKTLSNISSQLKNYIPSNECTTNGTSVRNIRLLLEMEENATPNGFELSLLSESQDKKGLLLNGCPFMSDSDAVIGHLLHLSAMKSPSLAKAWFALASWCYKWGRKAVDNACHGSVELLEEEKMQICNLLPAEAEIDKVTNVLSKIHTPISSEEDISDQDQSLYDDGAETTRKQLVSSCVSLQLLTEESIDGLMEVWKGVVRRVYHYYELSVKSYFKYLQLNAGAKNEETNEDVNIIATLRLLRLLVKHAWELRSVLETGLAETPTAPWKGIIPQLFSRLSHPESYVRQSVSDLLCRVAEDAPHLIVYPAVVGCSVIKIDAKESNRDGLLNNYLIQNEEDCTETVMVAEHDSQEPADEQDDGNNLTDDPTNTIMQICLTAIVDTLSHHNSEMIQQVQQVVQELRRITLLWDELWLGTLNQHHQDVTRRLAQLENEVKKVGTNKTLSKEEKVAIIREKHKTIMKPTLYTMERLVDVTSQTAETPHEQWFQTTYGRTISEALNRLKNPNNPSNPHASWQLFKQLHHSLQQRAQKRNSLLLRMDEISPKLGSMHKSEIPMPGLTVAGKIVTIHSMSLTVQILPTKTKPKKLVFIGTDGKKYPYLFKGLEDLHLDERIMQFLNIVNSMFSNVNRGHQAMYRARHYSVTPLGPRSGLIQWVDGATPLFSLYKKWQQREMIAHSLKPTSSPVPGTANVGSLTTNTNPVMQRPSDIYYNKLTPALKEKGIINLENRKEWPLNILKKVLEELMSETPKDLLAKELWCASTGPSEWWHKTQTYSRSTAVMSMIGYIIGLGDRHLDNVLVDLSTGEVVHIDYNVCFEKGKGLRVPEKVPFRMTQNIETALGVTGIEGTFRTASEHVIKTMRKGRETLLTLLEAFVYDPLVDWTTGNEGGYTGAFYGGGPTALTNLNEGRQSKRDMERDITISMFAIRVAEMKASWLKNKEDMLSALPLLQNIMQDWGQQTDDFQAWESKLKNLEDMHSVLNEALMNNQHALYTLSDRYSDYAVVKNTRDTVQATIQEKIADFSQWHANHKLVLQNVQGAVFQKMFAEVTKPLQFGAPSFSAATNFLQAAGQGQIVQQCEQLENELVNCLQNQRSVLRSALDILHTYATIIGHFGPLFAEKSRTSHYLSWLQRLLMNFTSDKCSEIVDEFDEMFRKMCTNSVSAQPVLNIELKLQTIINNTNTRLIKLMDRRSLEVTDTPQLEVLMEQATCLIKNYIQENKNEGRKSLTAVIVTALCSLNKRYLLMESAADAAGDRLMDLTSRDGDWFLDELCSMSGNVTQLLEILVQNSMISEMNIRQLHTALTATHKVYIALHELNVNFRNIIIPEALKTIQAREESVHVALKSLHEMILNVSCSLDQLSSQLEILHRNVVMGIENNSTDAQNIVHKLQNQFNDLLKIPDAEPTDLSPGQMLLMAFNGLFIKLETEFSGLMEATELVDVADNWRNVDLIKEAKSYQLSSFTLDARGLMSSYFFVKRLQAMQEFFQMCQQFSSVLETGSSGNLCFDDEQLAKPVKKFIADYVRKQVIGFPSQILGYIICVYINSMGLDVSAEIELKDVGAESKVPLDDMCKKAVDSCLKNGQFKHIQFTQASSLTSSQESTWRKHDLARRLDENIVLVKGSLQRVQFQLARYQWLHEDIFTNARGHHSQMVMPNRASIMSEMRKSMSSLLTQENNLVCCMERYNQLESSITQRLRWAAGANPSLNMVLTQFEEESAGRKTLYETESKLASDVASMCQGILHFEAFRTRTPEALTSDSNFMNLINRCRESCVLAESTASSVTGLEEELMVTKPPIDGQSIDESYITSTLEAVVEEIKEVKSKYLRLKEALDMTKEHLTHQVVSIKSIVTAHHKLMSEIRTILKSVAKLEEQDHGFTPQPGSIRDYLSTYKTFSETLTVALKLAVSEDVSKADMAEAEKMINSLKKQTTGIYDKLISFAPPLLTEKESEDDENAPMNFVSGVGGVKKMERVSRDPRTGKAIQERNSYAVSVWRRVKMKLDGRDPDPNKRLTIQEQVDYVLKEATNLDNLAVLYEGWTPWV